MILRALFPIWAARKSKMLPNDMIGIEYKPILLGALFRNIGTPMVPIFAMNQAKQKYMMRDLQDWSTGGMSLLHFPKHFR